jgi:hypothetical protein
VLFLRFLLFLTCYNKRINQQIGGGIMKKYKFMVLTGAIVMGLLAGCSSKEELSLDAKHIALPDYVQNAKSEVQQAYIMASEYPQVLASVPCYCGCYEQDGHISNLDCFVGNMDSDNAVTEWDAMGVS